MKLLPGCPLAVRGDSTLGSNICPATQVKSLEPEVIRKVVVEEEFGLEKRCHQAVVISDSVYKPRKGLPLGSMPSTIYRACGRIDGTTPSFFPTWLFLPCDRSLPLRGYRQGGTSSSLLSFPGTGPDSCLQQCCRERDLRPRPQLN